MFFEEYDKFFEEKPFIRSERQVGTTVTVTFWNMRNNQDSLNELIYY